MRVREPPRGFAGHWITVVAMSQPPQSPRSASPLTARLYDLEYPRSLGVYNTYQEVQSVVDTLADKQFPVQSTLIVGTDLKLMERVTGRQHLAEGDLPGRALRAVDGPVPRAAAAPALPRHFAIVLTSVLLGIVFFTVCLGDRVCDERRSARFHLDDLHHSDAVRAAGRAQACGAGAADPRRIRRRSRAGARSCRSTERHVPPQSPRRACTAQRRSAVRGTGPAARGPRRRPPPSRPSYGRPATPSSPPGA